MTDTDTGSEIFSPTAFSGPAWDSARELLDRPRNNGAPLDGFRAGMAVRDLIHRYTYALDQRDLDAMLAFFADDCVITNGRGTHSGIDAIRADYEAYFREVPKSFHLWSNIVVRLSEDFEAASVSAYYFAMLAPTNAAPKSVAGVVADRIAKRDGRWVIRERTASVDVTTALAAAGARQEKP